MSYDIAIADKEFNYTSNMREFFVEYIPSRTDPNNGVLPLEGMQALKGLEGLDAERYLLNAINRIMADASHFGPQGMSAMWDDPNGWGDWPGATHLLTRMLWACKQHPAVAVNVFC